MGVALCFLWAILPKEPVIIESEFISNTTQIRNSEHWDIGYRPFLVVLPKKGITLRSDIFRYYLYEKTMKENLRIGEIDDIIFVYDYREPNTILAFVSLKDDLVFPAKARWLSTKEYYSEVEIYFFKLKRLLNNDKLTLSSNNRYIDINSLK